MHNFIYCFLAAVLATVASIIYIANILNPFPQVVLGFFLAFVLEIVAGILAIIALSKKDKLEVLPIIVLTASIILIIIFIWQQNIR